MQLLSCASLCEIIFEELKGQKVFQSV